MLAVAGCISQLKWLYFKHSPHSIRDMQTFDNASRGPMGAFELLTRLNPTHVFMHRNAGAGWAFWASILTILALALDPFAQQVLSFPLRSVPTQAGSLASISTAQIYDSGNPAGYTFSWQKNVEVSMQGAVMNGLYAIDKSVPFNCTTANCTWPTFFTIGICSSCTNVTGQTNAKCDRPGKSVGCNYTLPSGLELRSRHSKSSGGGFETTLNATTKPPGNLTDRLVDFGIIRIPLSNGEYTDPEAFDCSLSWCAKRYSKVGVSDGKMVTPQIRSWPLGVPKDRYITNNTWLSPFNIPETARDFDGPNRTFTINTNDLKTLQSWLAETFFRTQNQEAVARALYSQPDIPQVVANIATSMTNNIRGARNATIVEGIAFREETYIHVNWSWLILPGVVVLMGVVLLAATMWSSRGERDGLWKNSVLATMFMQTRGWDGLRAGMWSDMDSQTKGMKGKLEKNEGGGVGFVRS
jgi:hypothetical protein